MIIPIGKDVKTRPNPGDVWAGVWVFPLIPPWGQEPNVLTRSAALMSSITIPEIKAILSAEGYTEFLIEKDNYIVFKMDGIKVFFLIYTVTDGSSIELGAGWSGTKATMSRMNEWNRTKRFSRAYIDEDGDPNLVLDLDLAGGVTVARIKSFLVTARTSFLLFRLQLML